MKVAMAPQEQKTQGEEKLAVLQFRFPSKKLSSASNTSQGGAEKKLLYDFVLAKNVLSNRPVTNIC